MKIASTPKSKRALIMSLAAVIVVAAAAYSAYGYLGHNHGSANPSQSPVTGSPSGDTGSAATPSSGNEQKQTYIDQSKSSDSPSSPSTSSKQSTSILLTHKGQDGNTLQLRVLISAVTTGKCELTMTKSGQTAITKEVDIQPMADSSTCKGFDMDTTNMATGTWTFTIRVNSPDYTGSIKDKVDVS